MPARRAIARILIAVAILCTVSAWTAYFFVTPAPAVAPLHRAILVWILSAALAVAGALAAWRLAGDHRARRVWRWLTLGTAFNLLADLVWAWLVLGRGMPPTAPSVADTGFLLVYPCFVLAIWETLARGPRRTTDPEVVLDTVLLTFTAGAAAYELLLEPLAGSGLGPRAVTSGVAHAMGGFALLWLMLVLLARVPRWPPAPERLALVALMLYAVSDILFGAVAMPETRVSGGLLHLGWATAAFTLTAAAGWKILRPTRAATPRHATSLLPRLLIVIVALFGLIWLGVDGMIHPEGPVEDSITLALGGLILAARIAYSLLADRRYEERLEGEVEQQTRSLTQSLAAAAAAQHNLRLLIESNPDPVVLLDAEGRVLEFNAAAPGMVSAEPDATGRSIFDWLDPEAISTVREHLAAAFAGEVRRFEIPFVADDRRRGLSAVIYAPVREGGHVAKVLAIARDITEVRRTQAQLQQADKLAAMGQLVSGVAHEINNPAAIISGFAQGLLLDDLAQEQKDAVQMIRDEAMRIGQITGNLLAFARMSGRERTRVSLNEVVRRTHALRAYHLGTLNTSVTLDLDPTEPMIWGSVSEMQQMLLNLVINAEQALADVTGDRHVTVRTRVSGGEVQLDVGDTGPGIDPETRARIFDPFFTTKPEGVGTGLGLSICYGIVQTHAGRIWVESEPGHGATFCVVLPLDLRTEPRPELPAAGTRPAAAAPPLSVLVIDDEPGIRQAAARFLNRSGMQVRAVNDGGEALAVLKGQSFDVILCDVRMPGMNGREFLEQLRRRHPQLERGLIFSTGDALDPDTAALLAEVDTAPLTKPFDLETLERQVRDVAARREATPPQ